MNFENFHNAERDGWDARAAGYAEATALATLQIVPAMLEALELRAGQRLLDIACGPGYVAGAASALNVTAEGIDFAPQMIAEAKARFKDLNFQVGDVQSLPYPDNAFDATACNIGLFHVADTETALSEIVRVTRPGGRFAFSQWAAPAEAELYAALFAALKAHADMTLADPAPDAYRLSDPSIVENMMSDAGFGDLNTKRLNTTLIATGDDFFDFFMKFGVRVPLIVKAQTEAAQATLRHEMNAAMAPYKTQTGFEVPMPSLLYSGVLK